MVHVHVQGALFGFLAATPGDLVHLSEFKCVGNCASFESEEAASVAINRSNRHFEVHLAEGDPAAPHPGVGTEDDYKRALASKGNPVADKHVLKIAKQTLKYHDAGAHIMGGMNKQEARGHIERLTGRKIDPSKLGDPPDLWDKYKDIGTELSEANEGDTLDTKMGRAGVSKILTKDPAADKQFGDAKAEADRGKRILGEIEMSEEDQRKAESRDPDSGGGMDLADADPRSNHKALMAKARSMGYVVNHDPALREFMVYKKGEQPGGDNTYFTPDIDDAHDTMLGMAKREGVQLSESDESFQKAMMAKFENDPDVQRSRAMAAKQTAPKVETKKPGQAEHHKEFMSGLDSYMKSGPKGAPKAELSEGEEKQIDTKRLSDGTTQVGYRNGQGWVGLHNLMRVSGGYKSDNYPGIKSSVSQWIDHTKKMEGNNEPSKSAELAEDPLLGTGSTDGGYKNNHIFSDDQESHYTSPLKKRMNGELLKYAVGRNISCPTCKNVMDFRNAVNIDYEDASGQSGNLTLCGDCADKHLSTGDTPLQQGVKSGQYKVDVVDGRVLAGRRSPAMAAHNYFVGLKPSVNKAPDPEQGSLGLAEAPGGGGDEFSGVKPGHTISYYSGGHGVDRDGNQVKKLKRGKVVMTFHKPGGEGHVMTSGSNNGDYVDRENFVKNHSSGKPGGGGFNFSEPPGDSSPAQHESQYGHCGACKKDMTKKYKVGSYTRVVCPGCGLHAWMEEDSTEAKNSDSKASK